MQAGEDIPKMPDRACVSNTQRSYVTLQGLNAPTNVIKIASDNEDEPPESGHRASGPVNSRFIKSLTFRTTSSNTSSFDWPPRGPSNRRGSFRGFHDEDGPNGLHCVYEPQEALLDIIFVHGLNGGSYRTWRLHQRPGFFWPGEWLPQDQDFRNVRIHTFGYPADWTNFKQRGLSMNDFAHSLHSAMLGDEYLVRKSNNVCKHFLT